MDVNMPTCDIYIPNDVENIFSVTLICPGFSFLFCVMWASLLG